MTKGEATKQRILEASIKEFAQHGFSGTRLDAIARELGVTRQTLLFHFKDKLGLYDAAIECLLAKAETFARPQLREEFDSLYAYVDYLVRSTVNFHFELPEFARITNHFLLNPAPVADEASPTVSGMVALWQAVLEEGHSSGETRDVTLQSVISLVGGMLAYRTILPQGRQASSALQMQKLTPDDEARVSDDLMQAVAGLLGLSAPAV